MPDTPFSHRVVRWLLFFLVGVPVQCLVYLIYPFLALWFHFFVRGRYGQERLIWPAPVYSHEYTQLRAKQDPTREDGVFLDHHDDHAALIHSMYWASLSDVKKAHRGLKFLTYPNGAIRRKFPQDSGNPVSGDCLSSWTSAFVLFGGYDEDVRRVATHYVKNCFGIGAWQLGWMVSARSSNGGVNYVPDSNTWGINQPALAPQYFTSAALLLLAARKLGGVWWAVYFFHWLFMGGWLWQLCPFASIPGHLLYDSQHITLLNLFTMSRLSRNPLYKWGVRYIAVHCAPRGRVHPVFYAWSNQAGVLTEDERKDALEKCRYIKHVWPQLAPLDERYFIYDSDNSFYSPMAGVIKMLS